MKKPEKIKMSDSIVKNNVPVNKGDRTLVWHDEFDNRSSIKKNWCFRTEMRSSDVSLNTDEKHIDVKNGQLELHTYRADGNDGIDYTIPQGLTTHGKMVFRRGYLEMRAKVPFRHGAWPSFWMLTYQPLRESKLKSEIDIFEIFSSTDTVVCNLHKYLLDENGRSIAHCQLDGNMVSKRHYTFPNSENLNNEYHVYGMEWTDKDISFFIDDVRYTTISLTDNYTKMEGLEAMDCYQDYHYVIFNNFVFTPGHHWCPEPYLIKSEDPCPVDYYIDWIRLYQKDGEEILVEE